MCDSASIEKGGYALVKWGKVCKRKSFGGLGIINLRNMNLVLLVKWWRKLLTSPLDKWATIDKDNYFSTPNFQ